MGKQAERSEAVGGSPDLGLIDMGGRIYDPLAGRFTTADPLMQAPFWSQGLNRYSYVFNDPINSTDPSGFATQQNTGTNALAVATDPAVTAWGGVAAGALAQGGLSAGLGALAGLGNIGLTVVMNPFGGSSGGSYNVSSPSGAPTSSMAKPNGTHAGVQNSPLSPLQGPGPCAFSNCLADGGKFGGAGSSGSWAPDAEQAIDPPISDAQLQRLMEMLRAARESVQKRLPSLKMDSSLQLGKGSMLEADVVVTRSSGDFVTILKGGEQNGWFRNARPLF